MYLKGTVKKDEKTKRLTKRLNPGDIALIKHKDLDELAAMSLAEKKVKCVINVDETISGKYPNQGPTVLMDSNIPIFEAEENVFDTIEEGQIIEINENQIICNGQVVGQCKLLDEDRIKELLEISYNNLEEELERFIENTLNYAKKEKG